MINALTIVMTTYFPTEERRQIAINALHSWERYIDFDGFVHLHIADDGSKNPLKQRVYETLTVTHSQQNRQGIGASLNAGFKKAFETSPIVLYMVDDWALTDTLYLTPWVKLLEERDDVGMVRLGPPHPHTSGRIEMFTDDWQGWGLRYNIGEAFAFGHRPALYHKRMIDRYGWFVEGISALECERIYAHHFEQMRRAFGGPDVVLALPHPFIHLESESLSTLEPS